MEERRFGMGLEDIFGESFITSKLDVVVRWCQKNSVWPMPMGISCCAIEMMAFASSRFDVSRFGSEVFRFSPRQSDLMIVAGTTTYKMAHVVRKIYDQMPDPKWVIAMGVCTSSGGMYRSYLVVQGIDQFIPVDVYVGGCPPRPDNLINALMMIQKKIQEKGDIEHHQSQPLFIGQPTKIPV